MQKEIIISISLFAGALVVAWLLSRYYKRIKAEAAIPPGSHPIPAVFNHAYETGRGVSIYTVDPLEDRYLPAIYSAIDAGLQNLQSAAVGDPNFAGAALPGSIFKILLLEPDAIASNGGPVLVLRSGDWTAGTVIGVANDGASEIFILLPHQNGQAWEHMDYFMRSFWHESEHVIEWILAPALFWTYVGSGDVHPHRSAGTLELPWDHYLEPPAFRSAFQHRAVPGFSGGPSMCVNAYDLRRYKLPATPGPQYVKNAPPLKVQKGLEAVEVITENVWGDQRLKEVSPVPGQGVRIDLYGDEVAVEIWPSEGLDKPSPPGL